MFAALIFHVTENLQFFKLNCEIHKINVSQKFHVIRLQLHTSKFNALRSTSIKGAPVCIWAKWPISVEAYPSFCSMKWLGVPVFLLPRQLVYRRVTPRSKFFGTHLYTWVKRGTVRVKCLAQEHNAVPRPGLEPGLLNPESSALTIRPSRFRLGLGRMTGLTQKHRL